MRASELTSASAAVTVRVNTFRRDDLLARFLQHYGACESVREITVVWSDVARDPPKWLVALGEQRRPVVVVERHSVDSLNNRFKPLVVPRTEAVFSVDDDMFVTCAALDRLVVAWRSAPTQMVGVTPRLVARREGGFRYLRWWHVWWNGAYSLVLTKVCVLHRDYLTAYSASEDAVMAKVRAHVDAHRNCEDIGMSFLVANATGAAPLWLRESYVDYGQSFASLGKHAGISAGVDHVAIRDHCLSTFARFFGRMPLVTGSAKLVDAKREWLW